MNYFKIFFSIIGIIAVICFSYVSFKQELEERLLRTKQEIIRADIIELRCGKKDHIRLRINGNETVKNIYLSDKECADLRTKTQIGIKMDTKKNIVFANDSYNDWSEAETVSIIILGLFFIFCIFYYGIKPEFQMERKRLRKSSQAN